MKIQIDFDNKEITLENKVNLKELFKKLNLLFPNNDWEDFTLNTNTIFQWNNTAEIRRIIYVPNYIPYNTPYQHPIWYDTTPYKTYSMTTTNDNKQSGKYNIEV